MTDRPNLTNWESKDWYERHVEEPIRPLVKLLRDNGFNTMGSCGHDMWVQLQYVGKNEDVTTLSDFLIDNGYKDFLIVVEHRVQKGRAYTYFEVYLNKIAIIEIYNPKAMLEMKGAEVEKI